MPHGVPSEDRIREGDFFTCDFGAVYDGYCSDTTRTVAVKSASDEMRSVYDIVLNAQLTALKSVKQGALCSDVDNAARNVIKQAGYGDYFGHATGHGVGLEIHEAPTVSYRSDTILKSGMIITDEPNLSSEQIRRKNRGYALRYRLRLSQLCEFAERTHNTIKCLHF